MEISAYHPFRSEEAKAKCLAIYDNWEKDWPLASESRVVDTSYGQTFVRISGPGGASPLVLLPGMSTTSLMWAPSIAALSEYYQTYAVDSIYDIGRSIYTRALRNPGDYVNWLDDLFNVLGFGENINLMGISLGGWVTSQYALRFPNRLAKIVLVSPAATVLRIRFTAMPRLMLTLLPNRYLYKKMFRDWILPDLKKKDASFERLSDERYMAMQCYKRRRRQLIRPTVLRDQELQSIQTPTLFLVGENEKIYSAQKAVQRLNRVAPQIKTEVIPNAGHDLLWVQTELFNKKIIEFLKQP